jgi:hypothetical protein
MAEIMGIPMVPGQSIAVDRDIDIASLYSKPQIEKFRANFKSYYGRFLEYMAENSLAVSEVHRALAA